MTSKPIPSRSELVSDVWANVCDILVAKQMDGTAAALARTSKELHRLVTPVLYDTVRINNFKALSRFLLYPDEPEMDMTGLDPDSSIIPDQSSLPNPPPSRQYVRHVEIECRLTPHPDQVTPLPDYWPTSPLHRVVTCHVKTVEDAELEDPLNSHMELINDIAYQIPAEHFRWEHVPKSGADYPYLGHIASSAGFRGRAVKSIEFPQAWQSLYDSRITAVIFWYCRPIGQHACGGTWYTDPDQTEAAGHRYLRLRDRKPAPGSRKPMYIVQIAQHDTPEFWATADKYDEMGYARRTAGSLTDFAIMEKMGLLDVKLVCLPEQRDPGEWRTWILSEGLVPGNGVQVDLNAIVERLSPGATRQPFEQDLSYDYARKLLADVNLFVKNAVEKHGPAVIETRRKEADEDYGKHRQTGEQREEIGYGKRKLEEDVSDDPRPAPRS